MPYIVAWSEFGWCKSCNYKMSILPIETIDTVHNMHFGVAFELNYSPAIITDNYTQKNYWWNFNFTVAFCPFVEHVRMCWFLQYVFYSCACFYEFWSMQWSKLIKFVPKNRISWTTPSAYLVTQRLNLLLLIVKILFT